ANYRNCKLQNYLLFIAEKLTSKPSPAQTRTTASSASSASIKTLFLLLWLAMRGRS
ncbi:hypothetical protein SOVF_061080, partial [Spinacia oleracea]